MSTLVTGTLLNRVVHLDQDVDLPDNIRVQVVIAPLDERKSDPIAALEDFQKRNREHPIHSGGLRFTRDELHERN